MSKINLGLIWAAITTTVTAVLWMFATFASAAEVDALRLQIDYNAYYDRLDDLQETEAEGNEELAAEYRRQMERIKARICKSDPEWERCKDE